MDELPKEYLELIGLIVIKHGIVERNLMFDISELMGIDASLTKRLISGESFDTLLSKFKKLLYYKLDKEKLLTESIKDEFKALSNRLEKMNGRRNDIIHSRWYVEKERIIIHKYFQRIGNKTSISKEEEISISSLKDFIKEISETREQLHIFKEKINKMLSN